MEKKELYEKAEKALNQAFQVAKESVKVVSEKAGEAAHITKLLVEKATLEHKATKQFAKLGSCIYEKAMREGQTVSLEDSEVKNLIEETKKIDVELSEVEATLEEKKREGDAKKSKPS